MTAGSSFTTSTTTQTTDRRAPRAVLPHSAPPGSRAFPLALTQEGFFDPRWPLTPDEIASSNLVYSIELDGELHVDQLERAVRALALRHEATRTAFAWLDGRVQQVVWPVDEPPAMPSTDLSGEGDPERALDQLIAQELGTPMDLGRPPLIRWRLFRLTSERHVLLLVAHHAVFDHDSAAIMLDELAALYAGRQLEPAPAQFEAFVDHAVARSALDAASWQDELTGAAHAFRLRLAASTADEYQRAQIAFTVPDPGAASVRAICRTYATTPFTLYLALYARALATASDQEDLVVVSPISCRRSLEQLRCVGCFATTAYFRVRLGAEATTPELIRRARAAVLHVTRHALCPRWEGRTLPIEVGGHLPLIHLDHAAPPPALRGLRVRAYEPKPMPRPRGSDEAVERSKQAAVGPCLALLLEQHETELAARLRYNAALVPRELADLLAQRFAGELDALTSPAAE